MVLSRAEGALVRERFLAAYERLQDATAAAAEVGANRNSVYSWLRRAGVPSRYGRMAGASGLFAHRLGKPHPGRALYEQLRAQGHSQSAARRAAGVSQSTAWRWDHGVRESGHLKLLPDGQILEYNTSMVHPRRSDLARAEAIIDARFLSLQDRERIAELRLEGASARTIARALGRAASTITRELARNSQEGTYRVYQAHRHAAARRQRPKTRKLEAHDRLYEYVKAGLAQRWSPEQICHALIRDFPEDQEMRLVHETIYQALYVQARGELKREVAAALRTGRARRKPHRHPDERTPRFREEMVMISQRPPEVEDRAVPGHWEGDLIIGKDNASAIGTLVERSSRYVMLVHLPNGRDAAAMAEALKTTIATLPAHLRGSLTWDQGAEMASHKHFSTATNMPVFFCDPHSPWQRGTNENTNGLLRQYFPKGTDLSVHGPEDLEHVAQELNGRPRKTLGWDSPAERLASYIQ